MSTQTGSISFEAAGGFNSYAKQNYATLSQIKGQFATCGTGAATAAKVATIVPTDSGWTLYDGATITVKFTSKNTAENLTLNVNGTGAKPIKDYTGNDLTQVVREWPEGTAMALTYDGSSWRVQDSNLMERVHTAETSIKQNTKDIELKANTSDVYNKDGVDNLIAQEVLDRDAAIELSATGIKQIVSETYATKSEAKQTDSDSGKREIITEDAAELPLLTLTAYGECEQDGTPTPDAPVEIKAVAPINLVGMGDSIDDWDISAYKVNKFEDGRLYLNVQNSGLTYGWRLKNLPGNRLYSISAYCEHPSLSLMIRLRNADDTDWLTSSDVTIDNWTYNSTYKGWHRRSDAKSVIYPAIVPDCLYCQVGVSIHNNNGASATATPVLYVENLQAVEGYYAYPFVKPDCIGIYSRSKNWFNPDRLDGSPGWSDGVFSGTPSTLYEQRYWVLSQAYPSVVTMSFDFRYTAETVTPSSSNGLSVTFVYTDSTYKAYYTRRVTESTRFSFTSDSTKVLWRINFGYVLNAACEIKNIQIEPGTTATEYEPYRESVSYIDLKGEELCSTQDVLTVDASGHVWIEDGSSTITLDGSENWLAHGSIASWFYVDNLVSVYKDNTRSDVVRCDRFVGKPYSLAGALGDGEICVGYPNNTYNAGCRLVIKNTACTTAAEFKAWLASNPTTIVYRAAESQTIDLGYIDPPITFDDGSVRVIAEIQPVIDASWWTKAGYDAGKAYNDSSANLGALEQRVTTNETSITQTKDSITSLASLNETWTKPDGTTGTNAIKSQFTQTASEIEAKVSKDGVIAAINLSTEQESGSAAKISADKVNIEGAAIFSSGSLSKVVTSTQTQWYSSTSATTKANGSWGTTQPTVTAGRYIWERQYITYSNGDTEYKPSEAGVCIQGQTDLSAYSTTSQMNTAIDNKVDTTADAITSRGEQLVTNGNGFMGDNTNWSAFTFDGAKSNGSAGSFTIGDGTVQKTVALDEMFPIDSTGIYTCSFDVFTSGGEVPARIYAYLKCFDVDKKEIAYENVWFRAGSTTTLTQELKAGDTVVHLADVSGFVPSTNLNGRSLIFWDYTNSFGYTYPPETYSKNILMAAYEESGIDQTANTITLKQAYSGKTHAAGTSVSRTAYGSTYTYYWYRANGQEIGYNEWEHVEGTYKGFGYNDWYIRHGTAYCQPGFLINYAANTSWGSGVGVVQRKVWITNLSVMKKRVTDAELATVKTTADAAAPKTSAVSRTQRIYYQSASTAKPDTPGTVFSDWVSDESGAPDKWTLKRMSYSSAKPYIYTCEQKQVVSGTVSYTPVLLDDTTTVIDGGKIITGSVTANALNADNINASKTLTIGAFQESTQNDILNSNISVGGRNLYLIKDSVPGYLAGNGSSIASPGTATKERTSAFIPVVPGELLMYQVWMNGGGPNNFWMAYTFYTDEDMTTAQGRSALYSGLEQPDGYYYNSYGPIEVPSTAAYIRISFRTYGDYFVKLEKGNKPTDWTPAPEDTEEAIASVKITADAAAPKSTAVARTQRIYYRTNTALSSSITGPTAWIGESGNKYNTTAPTATITGWSTKPTPLAASTAADTSKYLYLYTCIQTQTVAQAANNGTQCSASTVLLDDTETIIDGGNIITGSVSANSINANSGTFNTANIPDLSAEKITSGDIAADRIKANLISAINAKVSDISALSATLGGFQVDSSAIHTKDVATTSNADNSIALSSADFTRTINNTDRIGLRFAIGDKFGVTGDGTIYASNVDLTGKITATSGTIGGASIDSNGKLQVPAAQITGNLSADSIKANVIDAINGLTTGQINASRIQVSALTIGQSQVTNLTTDINDAKQTATKYITDIDTNKGITIKPSDSSGNDYLQMNSTDIRFVRNNVDVMNLSDSSFRIGLASGYHSTINTSGLHIWNGTESIATNEVASFGMTARVGKSNSSRFLMNADSLQGYNSSNKLYFEVSSNGIKYGTDLTNSETTHTAATTTQVSESNNAANTVVTVYLKTIDYEAGTATLAVKCMRGTTEITPSGWKWTKGTSTDELTANSDHTLTVTDLNAVYNCTVTIPV